MNYLEVIPKLEERFPDLSGKFSLRVLPLGGKCRIYINLSKPDVITYIDMKLYKDKVLLAQPKSFLKTARYISKYTELQKTRNTFYKAKDVVNYINKELICRGKTKKLEKSPKYKEWYSDTAPTFN